LAGYLAISGYIYDPKKLLEEINPNVKSSKWLCTHGTQDAVLPYLKSEAEVKILQDGGFDVEFRSYFKEHTIDRNELDMIVEWMKEASS